MKLQLPKIAETLLQASNDKDVNKYLSCFAEDAVYADVGEGETMVGIKAIEENFRHMKYEVRAEPTHVEETADGITMKTTVTGNFKGSPLNIEYQMRLKAGLIQDLRVVLI